MGRTFFAAIFAAFLLMTGCSSGSEGGAGSSGGSAALTTDEDKTVYALGLVLARQLKDLNLSEQELTLVKQAISDSVAGKPAVDLDTYGPMINDFASKRITAGAAAGAAAEKEKGKAFAENAAKEAGAKVTSSGLVFRDITAGSGASPKVSDMIRIHYKGTFLDGKEFDSSFKNNNGMPVEFPLGNLIPCWQEALPMMKVGGKASLVCPSDIAYGDQGRGDIPGGATLLFEIELVGIG